MFFQSAASLTKAVNVQVGDSAGLSVVVINNPRGHEHLGHYLCTANSTLGTNSKTLQLRGADYLNTGLSENSLFKTCHYKWKTISV